MSPAEPDDRLPPPAFPSGMSGDADAAKESALPEGAVISPDAPVERSPRLDDAFISPDDPVVRDGPVHPPEDYERVMHGEDADEPSDDDADVVVTGIGVSHRASEAEGAPLDPYLERVVTELEALVGSLRRKGEAGLRTEPHMTRFESTLRGYCMGYLAALQDGAVEGEPDLT